VSHHFLVAANENGMILDQFISGDVKTAVGADAPFQFRHVFLFSHGWWTNAIHAMEGYNRFTIEFSRYFRQMVPALLNLPVLSLGIHWPSTLSEDEISVVNYFQALSFYTMEKRADTVGVNAAYTLLRGVLDAAPRGQTPLRIFLLGHSFGAKVVCSALERLVRDAGAALTPDRVAFVVALLEAAFDNDEFEAPNDYGRLPAALPGLRLLVTRSAGDQALCDFYPKAHRLARLLGKIKPALGCAGPSAGTAAAFGGATAVAVGPGFTATAAQLQGRLVVADLSPLHQANPKNAVPLAGHHVDMYYPEIYCLLSAFFGLI
jgi:hypothetical protein